ncbi:FAD/NAD(P)-binding domain-containing protein [Gonapodya prolifera JEL478]|uniref:FAD/NAD(P)-binding domain-containing protein n=1 Tax=Gonapodya prolifera (strain JEL478) TaxID=1344416 RepID=A0A139AFB5_GONPJ|nr:FAD/NAD(P)-binding domain-containing protein [Gonapodya prolifera JEL478]|eukprot:KXS15379.1 FAD/NAD(P)-binding domain-containing protein [Gonapodya prolifera JEL478]
MSSYSDGGAPVVAIIGTGFSGLCAGPNLAKKLGLENFVIFEKSNGIGGTWRHQRYPGAACDVAAHAYSLSFELNPEWSCEFPPRTEIKSYMEHVFDKYNVGKYVRFNTEILSARWNEQDGLWELHWREFAPPKTQEEITKVEGEGQWGQLAKREIVGEGVFKANIFYNSSGPFTRPYAPNYPGVDLFQGQYIHTIEWDDTVPLKDKRVAVIGTGPSGLQVVSQVVHEARQLDVYQRTAAWIFPWGNAPFTEEQKALWRSDLKALEAKRQSLMDAGNGLWVTIENPNGETHANFKTALLGYLSSTCKKPGLYEKLVPNFPIGCKRFLIDCNYVDALNKDNCDLIVDPIDHVTERGIVGRDKSTGKEVEREYDVIVWATGWGSFAFGRAFPVYGVGGKELWDYWRKVGNPSAYLGAMSNSFPNMIYTCGPNGTTFDSFVEMIEIRVDFMVRAIKELQRRNAQWLMPKLDYELGWTRIVNEAGRVSPFGGSCISYYKFTWEAWDEAGTTGGGHIGKQSDKYKKVC